MNEKLEVMNQESPKKFGCNVCDFLCDKFSKFQIHKSTTKHKERVRFGENHKNINENEIVESGTNHNGPKKFYCNICDVACSKFSKLKLHCYTDKHKNNVTIKNKGTNQPCEGTTQPYDGTNQPTYDEPKQSNKGPEKVSASFSCKNCDKIFKSNSGLWYHMKKCKIIHKKNIDTTDFTPFSCKNCDKHFKSNSGLWYHTKKCKNNEEKTDYPQLVATLLSRNIILQEKLNAKNDEIQIQLLELVKEGKIINNVNNNINNVTNEIVGPTTVHFNLNLYLNEECKDAVNLIEFAKSVDLQLSDLEATGELGYVDGLSNIIIKSIKKIDVNKRPIHCSDLKRETIYVKHDNIWKKEDENNVLLKKAISYIEAKNIQQIPKWIEAHPNCIYSSNKGNTEYLKMVQQCTGGVVCNDETNLINMNKIIKKIIKEMVIKKH